MPSYADALKAAMGGTATPPALPTKVEEVERLVGHIAQTWPPGLQAWLYRVLHDGVGLRRAACDKAVRDYRKTLASE